MKVRAKFTCNSIRKHKGFGADPFVFDYEFSPVTQNSGAEENDSFWKYTPSGSLSLGSIKEDLFEVGSSYYLDFTKVEEDVT